MSRRHNDANVLVLASAFLPDGQEVATLDAWFAASFEGGRHARRIAQIAEYERSHERR
jgi:ribose 5-phosphate isomerase B